MPFADGRPLQPLFSDPARSDWDDEILCAFYGGEFLKTQRMVITGRFKYVFNTFDFDEMYDLEQDPEEMHNVVGDDRYRADVDDMRARMYRLMDNYEDPYGDVGPRNSVGLPPGRWCAPRYLPRGKLKE